MQRRWAHRAVAALAISSVWWLNRAPQSGPTSSQKPFSGTLIPQIGHAGGIRAFIFAPNAKTVATLGETIKFWDIETGALRRTLPVDATIWQPRNLRFSPQGQSLAFLDDTPQGTALHLLDVASGRSWLLKVKANYCRDFAFVQEGQICLNTDNHLLTYDIKSKRLLKQTRLASGYPWGAVADAVALTGWGNNWKLCDLKTSRSYDLKRASLQAAAFSSDGRVLATGQNRFPAASSHPSPLTQNKVRYSLLDVDEERLQIKRSTQPVTPPPVAPDGTLALWDARRGHLQRVITAFPAQVGAFRNLALSPDGRFVAAYGSEAYKSGYRTLLKQWDSQTGQLKGSWPLNTDGFLATTIAVGDDGTISVAGLKADESGVAGAPQVWNTRTSTWRGLDGGALTDSWKHLEWSPNGNLLAGGSKIGMTSRGLWGNLSGYYYSSYSLSGAMPTFIFTGGVEFEAQTVRLWDLEKGTMRRSFWGPIVPPRSSEGQGTAALQQGGLASLLGICAFSPDSRLIATDEAGAIVLRNAKNGAMLRTLAALPAKWSNIGDWSQFIWSPQGDALLAITSPTSTPTLLNGQLTTAPALLTLWNTQNGRLKAILTAQARPIQAAFAADGRAIVALIDKKTRAWDMTGASLTVAALPPLSRNTKELSPPILTRQGQLMRAVSAKGTVLLETREILSGKLMRYEFPPPFNGKSLAPRQLFVAPDGSSVAALQANNLLALWNLAEWKLLGHVPVSASHNLLAAPAPGGRLIAMAGPEGVIQIFDPALSSSPLTLQVFPARRAQRGGHDWAVFSDQFLAASPQAPQRLHRLVQGKMLPIAP